MSSCFKAFGKFLTSLAAAMVAVLVLLTLCGFAGRWYWRLEQMCHFRVQYFWLLTAFSSVLLVRRRSALGIVGGIAALINAVAVVSIYLPVNAKPAGGKTLKIVSFNVLSKNSQRSSVITYLREQGAELVLLMEVSDAWAEEIEQLSDEYPYRHVDARYDNFGIALLSKSPWTRIETVQIEEAGVPSLVARFDDGSRFTFIGTHPLPPGTRKLARLRNEQLQAVAQLVRGERESAIVCGDLNVTSFSPYFHDLLETARLRDSRQGYGIQASWGPVLPMEISIDHCLVTDGIEVVDRFVGPHLGSDHRPVVVTLRLPSAGKQAD